MKKSKIVKDTVLDEKSKKLDNMAVAEKPAKVRKAGSKSWLRRNHHADTVILSILAVILLGYSQIFLPNHYASNYEARMIVASNKMQDCAADLSDTAKQPLFSAPDVSLEQKHESIDLIQSTVKRCNDSLQEFNRQAQSLQQLKFSGYTPHYRSSQTVKSHGLDIAGQSSDVLNQYLQLASFLGAYLDQLTPFVEYTAALNEMSDTNQLYNQVDELASRGNEIHQRAAALRKLKPVHGFENIIQPTALMLDEAANGFDNLAIGYQTRNDAIINVGFEDIEKAVAQYDKSIKNMPFDGLQTSYIAKQATGLSVKFNDLKSDVSY